MIRDKLFWFEIIYLKFWCRTLDVSKIIKENKGLKFGVWSFILVISSYSLEGCHYLLGMVETTADLQKVLKNETQILLWFQSMYVQANCQFVCLFVCFGNLQKKINHPFFMIWINILCILGHVTTRLFLHCVF